MKNFSEKNWTKLDGVWIRKIYSKHEKKIIFFRRQLPKFDIFVWRDLSNLRFRISYYIKEETYHKSFLNLLYKKNRGTRNV